MNREKISQAIYKMIEKIKSSKEIEVAFERALSENFKNKLILFKYLPFEILDKEENVEEWESGRIINTFLFVSSIIANHLPNSYNDEFKNGNFSVGESFAYSSIIDKNECMDKLLRENKYERLLKCLKSYLTREKLNINYVTLFYDLFYFNERTKEKWAKDYYLNLENKEKK